VLNSLFKSTLKPGKLIVNIICYGSDIRFKLDVKEDEELLSLSNIKENKICSPVD